MCEISMHLVPKARIQLRFSHVPCVPHCKFCESGQGFVRQELGVGSQNQDLKNVHLDSHLSVTGGCRSLVNEFRGGQWVTEAMVSSLCNSRMPQSKASQIQDGFEVCARSTLPKSREDLIQ